MAAEEMVGKLATAEYNKTIIIAPARNTEGGGFLGPSVQALREGAVVSKKRRFI
jgi:hypothetical protein